MLFTFWTGSQSGGPQCGEAWRGRFPDFKVFEDADVLPLLDSDVYRTTYSRISIPACKSDLARLVLLREYGGLYVDSHAGPTSGDRLFETISTLSAFDLILFDKTWERKDEGDIHPINSAMGARRNAAVLTELISGAFDNLRSHMKAEQESSDYVPYNIFALTGAWDISVRLFDRSKKPYLLRAEFESNVFVHELKVGVDPGFQLYKFYEYRKPGDHWSERQNHERLFRN